MRKYIPFLIAGLIILESCTELSVREPESFVQVKGIHFSLGGKPYYFGGTNFWYGAYLGSPGKTGDRNRLKRELDNLSELGITNLRVCAASEESLMGRSIRPAFQKAPGVYDEELLEGLDYLLAEMGKRNMKAKCRDAMMKCARLKTETK